MGLRRRLEQRLGDGERLRWLGRPNAWRAAGGETLRAVVANLLALLVGTGMSALGIMWEAANPAEPVWPWFWWVTWGVQCLAVFAILSRTFSAYRRARRTVYAITDRQVLECCDLLFSSDCSVERSKVEWVRACTWPDGHGEIVFEPRCNDGPTSRHGREGVRLECLDDVAPARMAVEQMLGRPVKEAYLVFLTARHALAV